MVRTLAGRENELVMSERKTDFQEETDCSGNQVETGFESQVGTCCFGNPVVTCCLD